MKPNLYIWQMNDGRWHISALSGRSTERMAADVEWLWKAKLTVGSKPRPKPKPP